MGWELCDYVMQWQGVLRTSVSVQTDEDPPVLSRLSRSVFVEVALEKEHGKEYRPPSHTVCHVPIHPQLLPWLALPHPARLPPLEPRNSRWM